MTKPPRPEPSFDYVPVNADSHKESTWMTWLIVSILIGAMIAGYLHVKELLVPRSIDDETIANTAPPEQPGSKKRPEQPGSKKRTASNRKKGHRATSKQTTRDRRERPNDFYENETFWDDDELDTDERFRLGDVFSESDDPTDVIAQPREPAFVPPPDWWQPDGPYSPTSEWTRPGIAEQDVIELNIDKPSSSPLKPEQIERVLTERRLMPCYREVAERVPQIRGRLDLNVWIEDGNVSHVKITRSRLRSRKVEDCIVETVRRLTFPGTNGRRTRFSTHFNFD